MAETTGISWTDSTWNLVWGCVKISDGCLNCYADALSARYGHDVWGRGKSRRTFGPKHWADPLKWNEAAARSGRRHKVFCSSMTDWALDDSTVDAERAKLWPLIRRTPWLDWQLLTKRADRIRDCLPVDWAAGYPNVWLGVSVENRRHGLPRVDHLRAIPATVRFLSVEPLLEDLGEVDLTGIDWVIVGGESGPGYRPMDHDWARSLRDQCDAVGTAFFFKQSAGFRSGTGTELDGEHVKHFPVGLLPVPV